MLRGMCKNYKSLAAQRPMRKFLLRPTVAVNVIEKSTFKHGVPSVFTSLTHVDPTTTCSAR